MKTNKNISLEIGILILLVIGVIVVDYVYINQHLKDSAVQTNNETIQQTGKVVNDTGIKYEVVYSELPKNSEIKFKVGDKFIYKIPETKYDKEIKTYTVEKTEKVDGRECLLVVQEDNSTYIESKDVINIIHYYTYYYDKETGKVLKMMIDSHIVKGGGEDIRATDSGFFAYWMLSLSDNAKWEIKFTETRHSSKNSVEHLNLKLEFQVIGKEKINGRECFKVEKRIVNMDKNNVEEIDYYWVDVKKRILIKEEFYTPDKVKFYEINLVSEI